MLNFLKFFKCFGEIPFENFYFSLSCKRYSHNLCDNSKLFIFVIFKFSFSY